MTPRASRCLKLVLLVLLVSFISLQPVTKNANAATCGTICWQICQENYFDCLALGGTPTTCCPGANRCASFCGAGCPRFC